LEASSWTQNNNFANQQTIYNANGQVVNVVFDNNGNIVSGGSANIPTDVFGNVQTQQYYVRDNFNNLVPYENNWSNVNQVLVAPRVCTVPVDILRSEPFGLVSGEGVYARIVCGNTLGMSIPSDTDNGAIIPRAPDMCSNIEMTSRTASSISFRWTDGLSDGGAPISCYELTQ
jgi:hypothetical protein